VVAGAGALGAVLLAACAITTTGVTPRPAPAVGAERRVPDVLAQVPAPVAETVPPTVPAPVAVAPTYLAPGVHEHEVAVDGLTRRWTTVVPASPDGATPTGLVIVLHGVGGRGIDMRSTGLEPLAAAQRVVFAYPDAFGGAWNDGRPGADPVVPGVSPDDTGFLRRMIEETATTTGADPRRVAVVGFSNGAIMASRVACELADRVAAVAVVAGSAGQGFEQSCRPARPVAVMLVAGSADRTVPYAGGRVADWGTKRRGYVAGAEDFFTFWRAQSGCSSTQPAPAPATASGLRGADCRSDAAVVRYRVTGGIHEWFRPPLFDTTAVVWDFVGKRLSSVS
jgi:polyhydroxybutyrate depolymerase